MYYLQSRYYDPEVGRFLNTDALASTGQGIIGNNMFAYCNNNPTNRVDSTGSLSVAAWATIAKILVGGVVSAVCELTTGGSGEEVLAAFTWGMFGGALAAASDFLASVVIVIDAGKTILECIESGASVESSILAGSVELLCSLVYIENCDPLIEWLVDATFGMGFSLISAGITKSIQSNAERFDPFQYEVDTPVVNTSLPTNLYNPSYNTSNYRPSYTGFGFISIGMTHTKNYQVPIVNRPGLIR